MYGVGTEINRPRERMKSYICGSTCLCRNFIYTEKAYEGKYRENWVKPRKSKIGYLLSLQPTQNKFYMASWSNYETQNFKTY